jgi:hypothetical protein
MNFASPPNAGAIGISRDRSYWAVGLSLPIGVWGLPAQEQGSEAHAFTPFTSVLKKYAQ